MSNEVGDAQNGERLSTLLAHRECIAVVKTERHAGREAVASERPVQLLERRLARLVHDLGRDRAAVLGVNIDRARFQRREQDAGVAEARPVLAAARARDDLAEDVGLGEALGADAQPLVGAGAAGEQGERHQRGAAPSHRA